MDGEWAIKDVSFMDDHHDRCNALFCDKCGGIIIWVHDEDAECICFFCKTCRSFLGATWSEDSTIKSFDIFEERYNKAVLLEIECG